MTPLLEICNLSVAFRDGDENRLLLDGVTVGLGQGEILGLVGESGSGKSLLCRTVMGLLPSRRLRVTAGAVRLEGRDILNDDIAAIRGRRIGMIFQNPTSHLDPVMTIGRQICEGLGRHRGLTGAAARAEAVDLLAQVGFPDPAEAFSSYAHRFSGGMRQRAMIAVALACEPEILIADEPTTALDVTIQAQILDLMRRLQRDIGMSILFITHNLGVVAEIAHEVAVMYAGRVVEQAPVGALFARPRHPYTKGLLACIPNPERDRTADGKRLMLKPIPGNVPSVLALPPGCTYAPRCPLAEPRCEREAPGLVPARPGHLSRCFRHELL